MKRIFLYILCFILGTSIGAGAVFAALRNDNKPAKTDIFQNTAASDNAQLLDLAFLTLSYIKQNDFPSLSRLTHREYGLIFSPCSSINLSSNQCFTEKQVSNFALDDTKYVWGVRSSTGDPIELTPLEYFSEIVYSFDYINAPVIGLNQIIRSGNMLENIETVFPDSSFVDFYIPGKNVEGREVDWSILRLVFEKHNNELMLTAIIHSEYTP